MISQGLVTGLSVGAAMLIGGLLRTWTRNRTSTGKIDAQGWNVLTPVAFVYPLAFVFPAFFLFGVVVSIVDKEPWDAGLTAIIVILMVFLGVGGHIPCGLHLAAVSVGKAMPSAYRAGSCPTGIGEWRMRVT